MVRATTSATIQVYNRHAGDYHRLRPPKHGARATALAERALAGHLALDTGCGPGSYSHDLGESAISLDLSEAMLEEAVVADARRPVRADLARLPFRDRSLGGAWSRHSHLHLPKTSLPLALAGLHRAMAPGAPLTMSMWRGDGEGVAGAEDDPDLPGRFFARWQAQDLEAVVTGAGFNVDALAVEGDNLWVDASRARTLPDTVGTDMHVLVCGLNPSLVAADAGYGFAGPTNRFWKVAVEAGLVQRPSDPVAALVDDCVGMTDLVKRGTRSAAEIAREEYSAGVERVRGVVRWLEPRLVLFVGLAGWRTAVDSRAGAGRQKDDFEGASAYVMPSTSGLNASSSYADLVAHMAAALAIADGRTHSPPGSS